MIATLLALMLTAQASNTLTCQSTGDHEVVYRTSYKTGGARPNARTVMASESWRLGSQFLYLHEVTYSDGERTRGALDWTWDLDRTRDVKVLVRTKLQEVVTYTAVVRIARPDGAPLAEGLPNALVLTMACRRQANHMTP